MAWCTSSKDFGLGDADRIERVTVEWPSGRRQEVNQGLEIDSTQS